MNQQQIAEWREVAITNHCRFAFETAHDRFAHLVLHPAGQTSLVLTVNSGYE
ncbi:MAG: hypothetical protein MOB07_23155 [Acidobacteria bacterium]|nr:hypothetical protein [Acidobacteriota bacterium]